jgi:hypothetical protein
MSFGLPALAHPEITGLHTLPSTFTSSLTIIH